MKVMLVDDSSTMRRIQGKVLAQLGFDTVIEAGDGQEGFEVLSKNSDVKFMLLDINMPKMNGIELLKKIRATPELKDVKVIMCSSEAEKNTIVDVLKAGANNYIVKPFTPDVLKSKLKDLKLLPE